MISLFNTQTARAEDLDGMTFRRITESGHLKRICEKVAAAQAAGDLAEKKRQKDKLPGVTWQAYFERQATHTDENAIANGLFILDYDHVDDPRALWERILKEKGQWQHDEIMVAHITPSGKGLRLVAKRYNTTMSIADCQQVFSSHYGLECDAKVKNLSRLSYLVPKDHFLYFDPMVFDYQWELSMVEQMQMKMGLSQGVKGVNGVKGVKDNSYTGNDSLAPSAQTIVAPSGVGGGLTSFKGIPYKDLVAAVVEKTGGEPVVGERNTRLYELARIMRYTVDFDPMTLQQILPTFGLGERERQATILSAVKSTRSERLPDVLYGIIREMKETDDDEDNESKSVDVSDDVDVDAKALPPVFREFVAIAPKDFKVPVVFSLLPILGTLASTARARYLDGTYHSPSFLTVVSAPQASGKSFARGLVRKCHTWLTAKDAEARLEEQNYRKALREAKNSKAQPKEPETVVRCVPASISVAKLLKRLDCARGLHLFTFCEEMDTVAKSNSSGAWAQKSDLYRNAFDNAAYGQDYMTDVSYSATLEVFYNLLLLGTPNAVHRFFRDPEDGLVSRICFTQIPDQFLQKMPQWGQLSEADEQLISTTCKELLERHSDPNKKRYYELGEVNKALEEWLDKQLDLAAESMSRARDTARRRAAVVGFRAALLAEAIGESIGTETRQEELAQFATYIAEASLNSILSMFGEAMEESLTATVSRTKQGVIGSLIDMMGDTFTRKDLAVVLRDKGVKSPVKRVIYYWKIREWIEKINTNEYRKLKPKK